MERIERRVLGILYVFHQVHSGWIIFNIILGLCFTLRETQYPDGRSHGYLDFLRIGCFSNH